MGALEFEPRLGPEAKKSRWLEVDALVELASKVFSHRNAMQASFGRDADEQVLADILRVGTSAGGAHAKAVVDWNPETGEVRSGQIDPGSGFEHWLLKFDGVSGNRDRELNDPQGYGAIEYAYYLMAIDSGIEMSECRLCRAQARSQTSHHRGGTAVPAELAGLRAPRRLADSQDRAHREAFACRGYSS